MMERSLEFITTLVASDKEAVKTQAIKCIETTVLLCSYRSLVLSCSQNFKMILLSYQMYFAIACIIYSMFIGIVYSRLDAPTALTFLAATLRGDCCSTSMIFPWATLCCRLKIC